MGSFFSSTHFGISRLFSWRFMAFSISVVASRFGSDGDGGGQTAAGPWPGWRCWGGGLLQELRKKLGEKTLRIQWLINVSPNSAFPPMKPLIYFSIWRYLGYGVTPVTPVGKLNALKKDRKSLTNSFADMVEKLLWQGESY